MDYWHPCGPLIQFGSRIYYDAGSISTAKVADFIRGNSWCMPSPTSRDLAHIRANMLNYNPNYNDNDSVRWLLGRSGEYSCRSMWEEIRIKFPIVPWAPLIWHEDNNPRCSFVAWLACKGRMRTKR